MFRSLLMFFGPIALIYVAHRNAMQFESLKYSAKIAFILVDFKFDNEVPHPSHPELPPALSLPALLPQGPQPAPCSLEQSSELNPRTEPGLFSDPTLSSNPSARIPSEGPRRRRQREQQD